jgi:hypothetical protein
MNLKSVIKKAGASRSTVSRVIYIEPYVSEKTHERVKVITAQEGFAPNPAARALMMQRTLNIRFIIPQNPTSLFDDTSYYFPTLFSVRRENRCAGSRNAAWVRQHERIINRSMRSVDCRWTMVSRQGNQQKG